MESYALIMQGSKEFNRLQRDMKPRDAVISTGALHLTSSK
jgi:hypothetical protein